MSNTVTQEQINTLQCELAAQPTDYKDRVRAEKKELDSKRLALSLFFSTQTYESLEDVDKLNLQNQERAMQAYSDALTLRIKRFK